MNIKMKVRTVMAIALILFGAAAVSAQTTGTITLTGEVLAYLAITVNQTAGTDMDLAADQPGLEVATVTEKSNNFGGYTVTLDSANAPSGSSATAALKGGTHGEELAYSVTYGGSAVTFTDGSVLVTDTTAKTDSNGVDRAVVISYTGNPLLAADNYSDTLTLTIAAK